VREWDAQAGKGLLPENSLSRATKTSHRLNAVTDGIVNSVLLK
jgi:hypothetical protein